jgi:hypothetical protein
MWRKFVGIAWGFSTNAQASLVPARSRNPRAKFDTRGRIYTIDLDFSKMIHVAFMPNSENRCFYITNQTFNVEINEIKQNARRDTTLRN